MKNYIKINGKKIELTQEQVNELRESLGEKSIQLSEVPVGDTFKIGEYEFMVLEQIGKVANETYIILKDILEENSFGENNDYRKSYVNDICTNFANTISNIVGADNLVTYTLDLTSDDGLKDYDALKTRMSLITTDMYRKYVDIFDEHKLDEWWWLATPFSTPKHDNDQWIKSVAPSGRICNNICNFSGGVRPFCILKSNIFVSE